MVSPQTLDKGLCLSHSLHLTSERPGAKSSDQAALVPVPTMAFSELQRMPRRKPSLRGTFFLCAAEVFCCRILLLQMYLLKIFLLRMYSANEGGDFFFYDRMRTHFQNLSGCQTKWRHGRSGEGAVPAGIHRPEGPGRHFLHHCRRRDGGVHRTKWLRQKHHHQDHERHIAPGYGRRYLPDRWAYPLEGAASPRAAHRCGVRPAVAAVVGRAGAGIPSSCSGTSTRSIRLCIGATWTS